MTGVDQLRTTGSLRQNPKSTTTSGDWLHTNQGLTLGVEEVVDTTPGEAYKLLVPYLCRDRTTLTDDRPFLPHLHGHPGTGAQPSLLPYPIVCPSRKGPRRWWFVPLWPVRGVEEFGVRGMSKIIIWTVSVFYLIYNCRRVTTDLRQ